MTDQLDRRIRELYAELAEATPSLPPLPERAPAGRWLRRLPAFTLAAAALVAVVVATAGVLSVTSSSDDAGDAVAATTSAPATTSAATTTSAADNGDAAETTAAPGTVTTLGPVEALALQCGGFEGAAGAALGRADESAARYETALDVVEGELFGLLTVVIELSGGDRLMAEEALDAVTRVVADARGSFHEVDEKLVAIDRELTSLATVLSGVGAGECTGLAEILP